MAILGLILVIVVFLLVLWPGFLADKYKRKQRRAIWCFTLLLGWSGVGWALAMTWALMED
jgi:hypothetical protein